MSEHDQEQEHEGGKPPNIVDEDAGDVGLGTETGANEPGDDLLESMPEERGEVVYPDTENPEGPPRTPQEGHVHEDADQHKDASRGSDEDE